MSTAVMHLSIIQVTRSGSPLEIHLWLPCKKLSPRYIGPFTILRQINDDIKTSASPRQYHISPTFHESLLKPFTDSVLPPPSVEPEVPPPPEIDTDDTIYQVQEVMNYRRRGGRLQYLVDWEGYGPEERSWVDRDDILDPSLLVEFHQCHPGHPAPRGRVVLVAVPERLEMPVGEGNMVRMGGDVHQGIWCT
ncbi:hypothetical protein QTP70_017702 [Hemibagrus guttatus]|uniref:Chromo domain-containing protein n=1 Tax=Hemibagrus guttatus TaxID=175788 RepID=A0AAE0PR55_9TELE|nr:hypothetical protein QTP70_017702 [Hemibagrus guttatus]